MTRAFYPLLVVLGACLIVAGVDGWRAPGSVVLGVTIILVSTVVAGLGDLDS